MNTTAIIMVWCLNVSPVYAPDPTKGGEMWSTPEFNAWADKHDQNQQGIVTADCVNVPAQRDPFTGQPKEDLGL